MLTDKLQEMTDLFPEIPDDLTQEQLKIGTLNKLADSIELLEQDVAPVIYNDAVPPMEGTCYFDRYSCSTNR